MNQKANADAWSKECPNCGKKNPDCAKYCMYCARYLKDFTIEALKKAGASQSALIIQELRAAVDSPESTHRKFILSGLSFNDCDLEVELNTTEYRKEEETYYILPLADYEDMLCEMEEDDTSTTYTFQFDDEEEGANDLRGFIPCMILEEFVCFVVNQDACALPRVCFGISGVCIEVVYSE